MSPFRQKWREELTIGCGGTDGSRTRNFRLDRAVLSPIELQSQQNEVYSIHYFHDLNQTFSILNFPVVIDTGASF
jgi:hypothetical protein